MKIIKQEPNILLERKRISLDYEHPQQSTPKKQEILKEVATLLGAKEELVKIRHVYTKYGQGKSRVIVHAYDNPEAFKRVEVINKKPKKKEEAKPKAEAK